MTNRRMPTRAPSVVATYTLLVTAMLSTPISADNCGQASNAVCDCYSPLGKGLQMTCRNVNLQMLPFVPNDAVTFTFSRNSFPNDTLANNIFLTLAKLTQLDLSWNSIATVQTSAFAGLSTLTQLSLGFNSISSLPDGVFKGLGLLTTLDLSGNSLTDLRASVFYGLGNLLTLDLNSNTLAVLPADTFNYVPILRSLNLDTNELKTLPVNLMAPLGQLTTLILSNNFLEALPPTGFFMGTPNLMTINLAQNRLSSLPPDLFTSLAQLQRLDLSGLSVVCDCSQYALRAWMDNATAWAAWTAAPATSGMCTTPVALAFRFVINVSVGAFICTTTTSTTTTTTTTTAAPTTITTATTSATTARGTGLSGAWTVLNGASNNSALTSPTPAPTRSDLLAIILGCLSGVLGLSMVVILACVLYRRCPPREKRLSKPSVPALAAGRPTQMPLHGGAWVSGSDVRNGITDSREQQSENTFVAPKKHVRLQSPHPTRDEINAHNNSTTAGRLSIKRPPHEPPRMNGLHSYAYIKKNTERAGPPDGAAESRQMYRAEPLKHDQNPNWNVDSAYYVSGTNASAAGTNASAAGTNASAAQQFPNRNAPAFQSLRNTQTSVPMRNAPLQSSLRATPSSASLRQAPAAPLPSPPPPFRPRLSLGSLVASAQRTPYPYHAASPYVLVASDLNTDIAGIPSQGSVDSGVHSLPYGGGPVTTSIDGNTPSSHRSFSPLHDGLLMTETHAGRPPLLEPRRYKNDTFV